MSQMDLEAELVVDDTKTKAAELVTAADEMKKKLSEMSDVLIRLVEKEQADTLKEINKNKNFNQTISKFKSAPAEASGEGVDQKLWATNWVHLLKIY